MYTYIHSGTYAVFHWCTKMAPPIQHEQQKYRASQKKTNTFIFYVVCLDEQINFIPHFIFHFLKKQLIGHTFLLRGATATAIKFHVLHARQVPLHPTAKRIVLIAATLGMFFLAHTFGDFFIKTRTTLMRCAAGCTTVTILCIDVRSRRRLKIQDS